MIVVNKTDLVEPQFVSNVNDDARRFALVGEVMERAHAAAAAVQLYAVVEHSVLGEQVTRSGHG